MEKSYNDIKAQEQRVIELATELGRYCDNKRHAVDIQHIAHITRNTLCQHGIPFFGYDPNEKKPCKVIERPQPKPEPVQVEEPKPTKEVRPTPTEKAENRVALFDWMSADEANRKKITDMARHQFINKMYAELLGDMKICELEGWDIFEYPRMLRDAINKCFPKPKQLTIQFV